MEARDVPAISEQQAALIEMIAAGVSLPAALGELGLTAAMVKLWYRTDSRFAALADLSARPDGPGRAAELTVLRHELTRAWLAGRLGAARAGEMLAGET